MSLYIIKLKWQW